MSTVVKIQKNDTKTGNLPQNILRIEVPCSRVPYTTPLSKFVRVENESFTLSTLFSVADEIRYPPYYFPNLYITQDKKNFHSRYILYQLLVCPKTRFSIKSTC